MTHLKLLKPGTDVETVTGKKATVTQVSICGQELFIQYQIVIWCGDERREVWVHSNEIAANIDDPVIDVEVQ